MASSSELLAGLKQVPVAAEKPRDPIVLPTTKPVLNYTKTGSTLPGLRSVIFDRISDLTAYKEVVIEYLVLVAEKLTVNYARNLESYGIQICAAGGDLSPLSWIKAVPRQGKATETYTESRIGEEFDDMLLVIIFSGLRLCRATTSGDYKKTLRRKFSDLVKNAAPPGTLTDLPTKSSEYIWIQSAEFEMISASYDAFWSVLDTNNTPAKMGTLALRDRELGVYLGVSALIKKMGIKVDDFGCWCWAPQIADQLITFIGPPLLEFDQVQSYIHYAKPFGMTQRSPYSVAACPDLYLFTHMVGLSAGLHRSRFASFPKDANLNTVMYNAKWLAYAFRKPSLMVPKIVLETEANLRGLAAIEMMREIPAIDNFDETKKDGTYWFICRETEGLEERVDAFYNDVILNQKVSRLDSMVDVLQKTQTF